jgi:hypothetical protein
MYCNKKANQKRPDKTDLTRRYSVRCPAQKIGNTRRINQREEKVRFYQPCENPGLAVRILNKSNEILQCHK